MVCVECWCVHGVRGVRGVRGVCGLLVCAWCVHGVRVFIRAHEQLLRAVL